ncbi:MAG: hypothetical protein IPK13_03010 [Deltaproteobacteria bacterium]|nr:hypothetical protein [Deltaproteobacteria bacterium]
MSFWADLVGRISGAASSAFAVFVVFVVFTSGLTSLAGCSATRALEAPPSAAQMREPIGTEVPAKVRPHYERILGAMTAEPDLLIYVDPRLCEAWCRSHEDLSRWVELARAFASQGLVRAEGVARLNGAAFLWRAGRPEDAYRALREAELCFSSVGDADGLAHVFEWFGFLFKEGDAADRAGEYLGAAYSLFSSIGATNDARRVVGYGLSRY